MWDGLQSHGCSRGASRGGQRWLWRVAGRPYRFERSDLLRGIVVYDAHLEVIRPTNDPVLPGDEPASAYGDIGQLECLGICQYGRSAVALTNELALTICWVS